MGRKSNSDPGFDPQGWMFTFSDLVTLLLTFFVMLLTMKDPEVIKLQEAFGMFGGVGTKGVVAASDQAGVNQYRDVMDRIESARDMSEAQEELARMLTLPSGQKPGPDGVMQPGINLRQDDRGTTITLANDLLFSPGSAKLSPKAIDAIAQVARVLSHSSLPVAVEGHTDSTPPSPTSTYPDNWSLSLARAHNVLLALVKPGGMDPSRLRLGALADTRPLAPNDTPGNRAMNRRTEIVILANSAK